MRYVIVLAALLTGCSAERWSEMHRQQRQREAEHQTYLQSPEGAAFQGCQFRVNAAMQGWRARSILDLEGTARGNQLMEQCMAYWRQTRQLP